MSAEGDAWVLIGLGSNLGDSVATVHLAMDALEPFAVGPLRRSSLWRTSPVDCPPDSDDYINAAVAFRPVAPLTPETMLAELKHLERLHGRQQAPVRNAPRELDLDLLLFGQERRSGDDFTLPHPRAVDRRFVLAPAAEVLPDTVWPGTGKPICALLEALVSDERVERLHVPLSGAAGDS